MLKNEVTCLQPQVAEVAALDSDGGLLSVCGQQPLVIATDMVDWDIPEENFVEQVNWM